MQKPRQLFWCGAPESIPGRGVPRCHGVYAVLLAVALTLGAAGGAASDEPAVSDKSSVQGAPGRMQEGTGAGVKQLEQCTLLLQEPIPPTESWNASTSNEGSGYLGYEFFWGGGHTITEVRWWGLGGSFLSKAAAPCERFQDDFTITFYEDGSGYPGTVVNWYTGEPIRTDTGLAYDDFTLYEYRATLNPPITLDLGWVSIEGSEDTDCWFLWMQSYDGDGEALHWQQTSLEFILADFSLCLSGPDVFEGEGGFEGEGEGQFFSPLELTHEVLGGGYTPGGFADIRVTFTYNEADPVLALGLSQSLPGGWTFDSVLGGTFPGYQPMPGEASPLNFIWYNAPAFPFSIIYRMRVPAAASGQYALTGDALYYTMSSSFEHWADTTSVTFGQALASPGNDLFSNRLALGNGDFIQVSGTNVGAGKESGEPNHAGANGGASVWWSWTAPSWVTSQHSVVIQTSGSTFDTVLGVYQGSAVGNLTTIASNDDAAADYTSQVIFQPAAGANYAIAVDGYSAAQGQITLMLTVFTGSLEGEGQGEGEGQAQELCPAGLLADPGFEAGNVGFWTEYNNNGYWIIYYDEGQQRTYDGVWFAWLGGVRDVPDISSVEQTVFIPAAAAASLQFYLAIPARSENGTDQLRVYLDETPLLTVNESNAAYQNRYAAVNLDVSGYANGQYHGLRFESSTTGLPAHTSFFVDEVCLTVQGGGQALTLDLSVQGPGAVYYEPQQAEYAFGEWVLLYPAPDNGARFVGWDGDASPTQDQQYPDYFWLLMTQQVHLAAQFEAVPEGEGEGEGGVEGEGEGHGSAEVYGTVRDAAANTPLAGVQVQLANDATGAALANAVTDNAGRYVVATPDTGLALKITFTKLGYQQREIVNFFAPQEINVNLAAQSLGAPTGLTAVAGLNQITLSWAPSTQVNLAGFNVYRAVGDGAFVKLNDTLIRTTSFLDANIETRTRYRYRLTASDAIGNESPPSPEVEINPDNLMMWLPQASGPGGGVVRVPLNVVNAGGLNPNGIDIVFLYPVELLGEFPVDERPADGGKVKVEKTVLTQQLSPLINAGTPGRLVITATGKSDNLKGEGHLFDVLIPIKAGAQLDTCQMIEIENAKFYDDSVPPRRLPVTFAPRTAFLCVNPQCVMGDVNSDTEVDSGDVLLMLQLAVRLLEANTCQKWAGDLNGDRKADSADAVLIQRVAAGLSLNPPPGKDGSSRTLANLLDGQKQDVSVSLGSVTARQGDVISVPVTVNDAPGIGGADLTVAYTADPSQLTLQSVSTGSLTTGFSFDKNIGNGFVHVALSKNFGKAGEDDALGKANGTLAVLNFRVASTATIGTELPIRLSAVKLRGEFADSFDWYKKVNLADGKIAVSSAAVSLTAATQGQGTVALNPPQGSYPPGTSVQLTAAPAAGWVFDHWTGALTGAQNPATLVVNSNASVTAVFVPQTTGTYTLTMAVQGSGTSTPAAGLHTYNAGTSVQVSAAAASGWVFDRWTGGLTGSQNPATLVMNSNASVTAVFVPQTNTYNLTITVRGSGTTAPAAGVNTYNAGTSVPVTATPAEGWEFDHWEGAVSSEDNTVTIVMNADQALTAVFVESEKAGGCAGCPSVPPQKGGCAGDALVIGLVAAWLCLHRRARLV